MIPKVRAATAVAGIAVIAGLLAAWTARPIAQQPSFSAGVELVTVDVTVLNRNGEPRTDLHLADFSVTVDGSPRRIVSARLVTSDAMGARADTPSADPTNTVLPPEAGRRIVLAIDREHIAVGQGQAMLAAAATFVDALPAADRVAVWTLPSNPGPLHFTQDREAVKAVLRRSGGTFRNPSTAYLITTDEAIDIADGNAEVLKAVTSRECDTSGCDRSIEAEAKALAFDIRGRARAALVGLADLIEALGTLPGSTHIVWITSGPIFREDEVPMVLRAATNADRARVTVHALQVTDAPYAATAEGKHRPPPQPDQTRSAAYALAGQTGGLAITPVAPQVGFDRLALDLSASYVLAFEPLPADRDGRAHNIKVHVRDTGWGSLVRARQSFTISATAPRTTDVSSPTVPKPPASPSAPEPPDEAPPSTTADSHMSPGAAGATAPVGRAVLGTDVESLTGALSRYAESYEDRLSAVVAEERYVQMVHPWRGNPKSPESEPDLAWRAADAKVKGGPVISRRQILSDILLVQIRQGNWLCFRDVTEVDGSAVRDRAERVRGLFLSPSPDRLAQLRRIDSESARYNLGDVRRTLNLPNVALGFMRARELRRFSFKREKDEIVDGTTARFVSYRETVRPTLVRTQDDVDIPLYGRFWLDAANGRVLRSELRFDRGEASVLIGQGRSLIRVDFRAEPQFDVLVPGRMWEWYEGADQLGRIAGDKTLVQGLAVYTGYRRFTVTTSDEVK
jgi:VWFA-related protein